MAVCGLRTVLLIVCVLELLLTVQRQVFDFLGYMWLPIVANFVNIILIIFGSFGAVQYITKYLIAYAIWSFMWLAWNIFLICYYLNLGSLNRESGLLSLGTDSVSWWEGNGWGCQSVWNEVNEQSPGSWRPARVEGCFIPWHHVELAQSSAAAFLTVLALPLALFCSYQSYKRRKPAPDKKTLPRRPVYTIELNPTETMVSESSLKPMTPRRVKRRSGSRGAGSVRRSQRRSYRNAGYHASTASLPRDARQTRPTSAHSSYSNFHAARPASYHAPEREALARSQDVYDPPPPPDTIPITTYETNSRQLSPGYDVVGPYNEGRYDRTYDNMPNYEHRGYEGAYEPRMEALPPCDSPPYSPGYAGYAGSGEGWEAPPPPAPPYSARATPQAPGPPAYQASNDHYNMGQ